MHNIIMKSFYMLSKKEKGAKRKNIGFLRFASEALNGRLSSIDQCSFALVGLIAGGLSIHSFHHHIHSIKREIYFMSPKSLAKRPSLHEIYVEIRQNLLMADFHTSERFGARLLCIYGVCRLLVGYNYIWLLRETSDGSQDRHLCPV